MLRSNILVITHCVNQECEYRHKKDSSDSAAGGEDYVFDPTV